MAHQQQRRSAVSIGDRVRIPQVAVRSEEPYRIHCYSILRSLAASDHASGKDSLGARFPSHNPSQNPEFW